MQNQRPESRKFHVLYKTTCSITGKYYIGMHSTNNIDDGYLGSGQLLWKSIKKYGKDSHKFEVLELLQSRQELAEKEKQMIKMRYEDELSFKEISHILSQSEVSLRKFLSRTIKKLRTHGANS